MANSSTVGTRYCNNASTYKKCETLARTNPDLAAFAASLFGLGNGTSATNSVISSTASVQDQVNGLDKYSRNIIQSLFSVELLLSKSVGGITSQASSSIAGAGNSISEGIGNVKAQVGEVLRPVSTAVGSTLGTLTNMLKDPIGAPFALPNTIMAAIDRVSPEFASRLDATVKKFNLDGLANLPSQVFGSLRSLASLLDSILALPLSLIQDLYMGLMNIMKSISSLLDSIVSSIFDFFFGPGGVLDSLVPVSQILELANTVFGLISEISELVNMFGGGAFINQYVGMIQGYAGQVTGLLSNPQSMLMSYIPPEIQQYTNMIRNPQQLLNQIVPQDILGQLSQIGQIPGLGFVTNSGYGLEGVMSALKPGIVSQILNNFQSQLGILGPLLGSSSGAQGISNTQSPFPPTIDPASTNPSIPTVQGTPVQLEPPPEVLQRKNGGPSLDSLFSTPLNSNAGQIA